MIIIECWDNEGKVEIVVSKSSTALRVISILDESKNVDKWFINLPENTYPWLIQRFWKKMI